MLCILGCQYETMMFSPADAVPSYDILYLVDILVNVRRHQVRDNFLDNLKGEIPPFDIQEFFYNFLRKPVSDEPTRVSCHNAIRLYIFGDNRITPNDRAIANRNPGHNRNIVANPYVIPNDNVPFIHRGIVVAEDTTGRRPFIVTTYITYFIKLIYKKPFVLFSVVILSNAFSV